MFNEKEYQRQYRLANKEKAALYQKEYYIKNKDEILARIKKWKDANPEKIKEVEKRRYIKNKPKINARIALWKKTNPYKVNAYNTKRKKHVKFRTPKWLTDVDFERMQTQYKLAEILTKLHSEPWHVDHIVPLQGKFVSGLHVPSNLQVIKGSENCSKQNTFALG
jgi:hypothetical protein